MGTVIHHETARFLNRFRWRRQLMLCVRGICVFAAVGVALWTGLALADWRWLVPDPVRWTIGIGGHVLALVAAWVTAFRFLFGVGGQRRMAEVIESADPSFGENLVSAVELADPTGQEAARYDSEAFRQRIQDDVAVQLRGRKVSQLLPIRRIVGSVAAAALSLMILGSLLMVPQWNFGAFFCRAALPLLNWARPSAIDIVILQPAPADRDIPEFDTVALTVTTDGPPADRVVLEVVDADSGRSKTEMRRERNGRFSAEIEMQRAKILYRVRANNSITRYYRLTPRKRPKVLHFTKTYHYPEYTTHPDKTLCEEDGVLSAVEDSRVTMQLDLDQPVTEAELQLESANSAIENRIIPLRSAGGEQWIGEVPITADYTAYRVHLVAEPDHVTNKFSPLHEIRCVLDQAPHIEMIDPQQGGELFTDQLLPMLGRASDDMGLQRIACCWRVDDGSWNEIDIAMDENALQQDIHWDLNLGMLDLGSSHLFSVKMLAQDGKGNIGETPPVTFALRPPLDDVTESRKQWTRKKIALAQEMKELARTLRETERAAVAARAAMKKPLEKRSRQDRLDLAELADKAEKNRQRAQRMTDRFAEAIAQAPDRTEEELIMAAARASSKTRNELIQPLAEQLQAADLGASDRPHQRDAATRANAAAWRTEETSRQLATIAAAESATDIANDAIRLNQRQKELAQHARKEQKENRASAAQEQLLRDRQEFNDQATRELREQLEELAQVTPTEERGRAEGLAREIQHKTLELQRRKDDQARRLESTTADDKTERMKDQHFAELTEQTRHNTNHYQEQTRETARRLAERAAKARKALLDEHLAATTELDQAHHSAQHIAHQKQRDAKDELNPAEKEQLEHSERELHRKLASAAQQLRDNAKMEEQRAQPDTRSVADQSLLARAIEAMQAKTEPDPTSGNSPQESKDAESARHAPNDNATKEPDNSENPEVENAKQIASDLAKAEQAREAIEADAQARNLADTLQQMTDAEAEADKNRTLQEQPAAWQQTRARLEKLPEALKQADVEKENVQSAESLKNSASARKVDEEMRRRRQQRQQTNANAKKTRNLDSELKDLRNQSEQIRNAANDQAEAARQTLAELAPAIPDQAKSLAAELEHQAEQNREAARGVQSGQATPNNVQLAEDAAMDNQAAGNDLQQLMDDLRRQANTRDLADPQQRELARDADDALTQLQHQNDQAQAQQALENATADAENPTSQSRDFAKAADHQQRLANQLSRMAENLNNPDQGRQELRAHEAENERGQQIAQDFQHAQALAEILDQSDTASDDAIAALEAELKNNPAMQAALDEIAQQTANNAARALQNAARDEKQLAKDTAERAKKHGEPAGSLTRQSSQQQDAINDEVRQAADNLARARRHQERLGNESASQAIGELAEAADQAAKGELAEAAEALAENRPIQQAAQQVAQADDALQEIVQSAQDGTNQNPANAQQPTAPSPSDSVSSDSASQSDAHSSPNGSDQASRQGQPGQQPGAGSPPAASEQAEARAMAEALDRLDKALAAAQSNTSAQQPTGSHQVAEALAAHAQSMTRARQTQANAQAQAMMPMPPGSQQPTRNAPTAPTRNATLPSNASATPQNGNVANASQYQDLDDAPVSDSDLRDWGKLPPKVAREILQSRRDGVSPEYRAAIESYYKALGQRARTD